MSSYTLDDIRAAAERKYGSTDIDVNGFTVRLVNPLRLPKEKREQLMSIQSRLEADNESETHEDQGDVIRDAIRVVCESDFQADTLLGAVGDDLAVLAEIFEAYNGSQEAGEA